MFVASMCPALSDDAVSPFLILNLKSKADSIAL